MTQPGLKKILIIVVVILLMSRTGKILEFLSELDPGGILTLQPLRDSPEPGRFLVTVALGALVFVAVWSLLRNRK